MLETNYNVQQKSIGSSGVPGGCSRRFIVSHLMSVTCVRQTEWPAFRHKSLLKSNLRRTTQHQPPGTPGAPQGIRHSTRCAGSGLTKKQAEEEHGCQRLQDCPGRAQDRLLVPNLDVAPGQEEKEFAIAPELS